MFRSVLEAKKASQILAYRGPLRLADLTGSGPKRLGLVADVSTAAYRHTQRLSRALHEHPQQPDGIRYRVHHRSLARRDSPL